MELCLEDTDYSKAAIPKFHKLGALKNRFIFSQF